MEKALLHVLIKIQDTKIQEWKKINKKTVHGLL